MDNVTATPVNLSLRDRGLSRLFPLHVVVVTAVVAIVAALVATAAHAAPPVAIGLGLVVFAAGTLRIRGSNVTRTVERHLAFRRRRRGNTSGGDTAPFDVRFEESEDAPPIRFGMRWDGECVVTMLQCMAQPSGLTLLTPDSVDTTRVLPMPELALCLTQFDITLDSMDVVSVGSRSYGDGPVARLYHNLVLGPLPATSSRTMWIILRFNPLHNVRAVESRGGGEKGTTRSAVIATRRVANRLIAQGVAVSVLTANQMGYATAQLLDGIVGNDVTEHWDGLEHKGTHLASFAVDAARIDAGVLSGIWAVPSLSTTLALRLEPVSDKGSGSDEVAVRAMARFRTRLPLPSVPLAALRPLLGTQLPALRSGAVLGTREQQPAITPSYGPIAALATLIMPTTGYGQVVGADQKGRGVAVAVFGPGVHEVEVVATLQLAHQIILRAIAVGARAIVQTNRPEAWRALVDRIGTPEQLSLPAYSAGQSGAVDTLGSNPNLVVFDGVPAPAQALGATALHILPRGKAPEHIDADVTVIQSLNYSDVVTVRTAETTATVQMVATSEEMGYLSASFASWRA